MNEFVQTTGPFIHNEETYKKTIFSYIIVYIAFFIYTLYMNMNIRTLIFLTLPILITLILETIYKKIFVKNTELKTYLKENFSVYSILFLPYLLNINTPLYIIIISVIIGYILYKTLFKKWYSLTILSYLIYIILTIKNLQQMETNQNILNLLLNGSNLMCPLIALLSFIYLYIKKDIKKEITISSLLTILIITLIQGILNKNLYYPLYFTLTGATLFITILLAPDFYSPATKTGKILYGIFIGLLILILRKTSNYLIEPLSILIANTFTFTFDYINEFGNKKITYLITLILIILTIFLT